MSYSNIRSLEEIKNKKVLFFDLETSGLVKTVRGLKPEEEYPDYKELEKYENARAVSIGWLYMKDFDYDYEISIENISELIIKPEGFTISEKVIGIHGITNEEANDKGIEIKKMLKKLGKIIKECDYIVGYNVYYDINVLASELYRKGKTNIIKKILKLKEEKKIICIGQISSKEAKPTVWKQHKKYAIPKLTEVYKNCYNEELLNAHNAKSDVLGMIKIMFWIYENKINSLIIEKNCETKIDYFSAPIRSKKEILFENKSSDWSFTFTIPGFKKVLYNNISQNYNKLTNVEQYELLENHLESITKFSNIKWIYEHHKEDNRLHIHGIIKNEKREDIEEFRSKFYSDPIGIKKNYEKISDIQETKLNISYFIDYMNKNQTEDNKFKMRKI